MKEITNKYYPGQKVLLFAEVDEIKITEEGITYLLWVKTEIDNAGFNIKGIAEDQIAGPLGEEKCEETNP